jgi:hypothetical protein
MRSIRSLAAGDRAISRRIRRRFWILTSKPRPGGGCLRWSKSDTSSRSCQRPPTSSAATGQSSLSRSSVAPATGLSLKLKHIDIGQAKVDQDARQVNTKFSKSFTTWFFPVGGDIHRIVADWVSSLRQERLWGLNDPLFPATRIVVGASRHFEAAGLDRQHWSTATPIRTIFKDAFTASGLPYFNPHSFRKTLALLGGQICKSPEEYKAWSQNLGHENVMTTFSSYGGDWAQPASGDHSGPGQARAGHGAVTGGERQWLKPRNDRPQALAHMGLCARFLALSGWVESVTLYTRKFLEPATPRTGRSNRNAA